VKAPIAILALLLCACSDIVVLDTKPGDDVPPLHCVGVFPDNPHTGITCIKEFCS